MESGPVTRPLFHDPTAFPFVSPFAFTMPVYEFSCTNGCENYEVWRSINERQSDTNCPVCAADGTRVFTPVMSLSGPLRLKREQSEPRMIRKETGSPSGKPTLKESSTRPWMLNRGC